MPHSQNATFFGAEPEPDGSRVAGASIARILTSELNNAGWHVGQYDDWRDSGFVLPIDRDGDAFQLVLSPYHGVGDRWILQIAPRRVPFVIARWFGARASATPESVHVLAIDTHRIITESEFEGILWCWDNLADHDMCTDAPMPVSAIQDGLS